MYYELAFISKARPRLGGLTGGAAVCVESGEVLRCLCIRVLQNGDSEGVDGRLGQCPSRPHEAWRSHNIGH